MLQILEETRIQIDSVGREFFGVQKDVNKIETAGVVGYEQMQRFLQSTYISEPPQVWVGGRSGGVEQIGRSSSVSAYDLAQTYGSIRSRLKYAIQTGQSIEVRDSTDNTHMPSYRRIAPDIFDLVALQATLEGASAACVDAPRGREVDRAALHLQKLLLGETFQKSKTAEYFHSRAVGKPSEASLIGAVIVLWTVIGGEPRILVQEETVEKPQFDKQPGDMSPLAEGRQPGEPIELLLRRMIREEIGWGPNTLIVSKHPIGFYRFPGYQNIPGGWIVGLEAQVDPLMALTRPVGSQDGETKNHMWVRPEDYFGKFPARGAMIGIVGDWMRGDRDKVSKTTPGRHDTQVAFEQGHNGTSGSIIIKPRE